MKKNQWRKTRERLAKREQAVHEAQQALRAACPHENLLYKYEGTGGTWDNPRGEYWIEWRCEDCGKFWTSEQNRDETDKYPHAKEVKTWK